MEKKKDDIILEIIRLLKPNGYADYHDIWTRTRLNLQYISQGALRDLYTLLLARNERKVKKEDILGSCEHCGELFLDYNKIFVNPDGNELCEDCMYQEAYKIYQKEGQYAVEKYGDASGLPRKYCMPCEVETPNLNGTCLVCGISTEG